jgi:hypothetical protein
MDELLSDLAPSSGAAAFGAYLAASCRKPLAPGGHLLGWEVLGFEGGGCHSLLCNSLHVIAAGRNVRPATLGLLASELEAETVVRIIAEDPGKAEPAAWFPVAVLRYDL